MAKTTARGVDLEPIDRLEDKIKALVAMVERVKEDNAQVTAENGRLAAEVESLRARLASTDGLNTEVTHLKQERDVIRTRVTDMLAQLEALSL